MKTSIKAILFSTIIAVSLGIGVSAEVKHSKAPVKVPAVAEATKCAQCGYVSVDPLEVVKNPTKYLNKKIKVKARFDKFSTLGLDYKPAFRSSEKFITFLIKRSDVVNYTVPLSEMKNFLSRDLAEKYIDLKPGDEIEYTGTVFSDALSDTWVSVDSFTVLSETFKEKTPDKK